MYRKSLFTLTLLLGAAGTSSAGLVLATNPADGVLSGTPGQIVGWGMTLTADNASYYVLSEVEFCFGAQSQPCPTTTGAGTFTDIASGPDFKQGGHNYPFLIRKMPKKDIRVFLADGSNDLDNEHGNWPMANQTMAKSLAWKGYDYKFVFGQGFHSDRQGRALLPESLRWLWRDYKSE